MANQERPPSILETAGKIVEQTIEANNGRCQQAMLKVLWELQTKSDIEWVQSASKPNIKRQKAVICLVQALTELIDDDSLIIRGRDQPTLFETAGADLGCGDLGMFFVGWNFEDELEKRPDSVVAEVLLKMASAALVDGNLSRVGSLETMGQVKKVVVDFLETLPEGTPLTAEQRLIITKDG